MCDSIKHDVVLAQLWCDRSKGRTWAWAWAWAWPWFDIGGYFCNGEQREPATLKGSTGWVTRELTKFIEGE